LNPAGLAGCDECADFTGALGDIAVGNVGSRRGATTVLIRTARGAEAWERAATALEAAPLADLTPVATLAARNRERAVRTTRRGFGAHRSLWVSYTEYLTAALGSERAPAVPPPHRSHHYTVAC
jgi:coenzyme F420 hydrogenase subunit beta